MKIVKNCSQLENGNVVLVAGYHPLTEPGTARGWFSQIYAVESGDSRRSNAVLSRPPEAKSEVEVDFFNLLEDEGRPGVFLLSQCHGRFPVSGSKIRVSVLLLQSARLLDVESDPTGQGLSRVTREQLEVSVEAFEPVGWQGKYYLSVRFVGMRPEDSIYLTRNERPYVVVESLLRIHVEYLKTGAGFIGDFSGEAFRQKYRNTWPAEKVFIHEIRPGGELRPRVDADEFFAKKEG